MKHSKKEYSTTYLFGQIGSFFIGFTSAFNLAGHNFTYNTSNSAEEADKKAIENDWGVVGNDLKSAANQCAKK